MRGHRLESFVSQSTDRPTDRPVDWLNGVFRTQFRHSLCQWRLPSCPIVANRVARLSLRVWQLAVFSRSFRPGAMSHERMTREILKGLKFLRRGAAIRPALLMVRVKNGKPSCVHWFVI